MVFNRFFNLTSCDESIIFRLISRFLDQYTLLSFFNLRCAFERILVLLALFFLTLLRLFNFFLKLFYFQLETLEHRVFHFSFGSFYRLYTEFTLFFFRSVFFFLLFYWKSMFKTLRNRKVFCFLHLPWSLYIGYINVCIRLHLTLLVCKIIDFLFKIFRILSWNASIVTAKILRSRVFEIVDSSEKTFLNSVLH